MQTILPVLLGLVPCLCVAMQAPTNAMLARTTRSLWLTASVSLVGGTMLVIAAWALIDRTPLAAVRQAPPWAWIGGLYSAFFVAAVAFARHPGCGPLYADPDNRGSTDRFGVVRPFRTARARSHSDLSGATAWRGANPGWRPARPSLAGDRTLPHTIQLSRGPSQTFGARQTLLNPTLSLPEGPQRVGAAAIG